MLGDRVIKTSFMISFVGHCLFLGMPGFNLDLPQTERREEIMVRIEIEKPPLLPKIDVMGEEKQLKETVEPPEPEPEPKPELEGIVGESEPELSMELVAESRALIEEVVVKEPLEKLETLEEKIEVVKPAEQAMLRYQDMVKQRIEEVRRYPSWAKRRGVEGEVCIKFAVLSNGLSQDIRIIQSSGSKVLDEEAVDTIRRASPFPPVPEEIDSSLIWMEVSIVFTLKYEQ